ncbi:efflux transporter outer membrane subunit [Pelomonas sp. KK5]|uniref:efflux transporter outer membrane subunit n=1 Tax=Pelomonas sp. KK5 TaxID=1855730 RepID=UPI0013020506|nr:efflux transporter outer membrane subunit [Pelomonas sp. KK5]
MRRSLPLFSAIAAAALLSACALAPKLPDAARPLTAEQAGLNAAARTAELKSDWWTAFNDPQLDALVQRALAESPSLAAARARIAKAAAGAEAAGAEERPKIELEADVSRNRFSANGIYPEPLGGNWWTLGNVQLGASYEWDFFGKHKAELDAAIGTRAAAEADAAAARLMLASQVSRAYLSLARLLAQDEILGRQLAEREQALALTRQRVAAGLDNSQELRGAEQPLPELRRQRLVLREQAQLLRHQLAQLSVQPIDALKDLAPQLPAPLALQAEGLGIDLLGRRPDVVAARWRVEAATKKVDSARAQFYPNVSLSAFAGFNALGLDNLLQLPSRQFGFGPSIHLPLFETGALKAQLHGAAADTDAAVAAYNGALLEAVRDARDQLTTLGSLQGQQQEQQASISNAESTLTLAESRYGAGLTNRLAVLNARDRLLVQQRQALDLRGQTLDSQVNLMRALGGGWTDAK